MSERSYDERPSAPPQTPPSGARNRREHVSHATQGHSGRPTILSNLLARSL